jgi:regulatory protein YycI of two-component signal transduction system YycFG
VGTVEIFVIAVMLLLALFLIWWWLRRPSTMPDNVIRKNVKKRCRDCGCSVYVDVFTVNPTCITCQDSRHA